MDLGEEPRGPDPPPLPYFGLKKKKKKESQKEEKPAGQAKKNCRAGSIRLDDFL